MHHFKSESTGSLPDGYTRSPSCQADDPSGLLFEERLERAERLRLSGNDLYKDGKPEAAENKYLAVGWGWLGVLLC